MSEQMAAFAREHVADRALWRAEAFPLDLWRTMGRAGLFRIGLPEEHGGAGGGYAAIAAADAALVEFGGAPGFGGAWAVHQMVARYMVLGFGSDAQKAGLLPGLASGELTIGVSISEPGAGAHPKHLISTAVRSGGGFVLNGVKSYASNGPIADFFLVFAITEQGGAMKRFSAFLIPRGTAGVEQIPSPPLEFLRPSQHCGLRMTDCSVPASAMVGPEGGAFEAMAMPFRDIEDAVGSAGMVAALSRLLRLLARATGAESAEKAAALLGGMTASAAVARHAAAALVAELDEGAWRPGSPPASLTGIRLLCADILERIKAYRSDFSPAPDDAIDAVVGDASTLLAIARGPRMVKQSRLGITLLRQEQTA
ncbi:MAG: acyl-CoA dehydrogenase [Rhodopila sp.]|nr:acyl-CoA dehydrogenase [Rhodopila sp.]